MNIASQRGATLLIALIMLMVLTLIVVFGFRMSASSLRITGNMQIQTEALSAAQKVIEDRISAISFFTSAPTAETSYSVDINNDGVNDYTVVISPPACLSSAMATGYSATFSASAPVDTVWDVKATVTDTRTGASVVIHQGIKVRLGAGATCPN